MMETSKDEAGLSRRLSQTLVQPLTRCATKVLSGDSECDCGFCKCHCHNAGAESECEDLPP